LKLVFSPSMASTQAAILAELFARPPATAASFLAMELTL